MGDAYHSELRIVHNRTVRVNWHFDDDTAPPWKEDDGHGPVREARMRHKSHGDKRPYERPLNYPDSNSWQFYYDWREAMKLAIRDGWYTGDINTFMMLTWKHKRAPTKRMLAEYAVERDFQYLKSWCDEDWHWCGIEVIDQDTEVKASLWGIESVDSDYQDEIIGELADDIWPEVCKALVAGELVA